MSPINVACRVSGVLPAQQGRRIASDFFINVRLMAPASHMSGIHPGPRSPPPPGALHDPQSAHPPQDQGGQARALVRNGIHPLVDRQSRLSRQIIRNTHTFEAMARDWIRSNSSWSGSYAKQVTGYLERGVFPVIGNLPVTAIGVLNLRPLILDISDRRLRGDGGSPVDQPDVQSCGAAGLLRAGSRILAQAHGQAARRPASPAAAMGGNRALHAAPC